MTRLELLEKLRVLLTDQLAQVNLLLAEENARRPAAPASGEMPEEDQIGRAI
jgi:hypothetical protein